MNKNEKVLEVALKSLVQRLEKTEKFVLDQMPEICQQMVKVEVVESTSNTALCVVILMVAAALVFHLQTSNPSSDDKFMSGALIFLSIVPFLGLWSSVQALIFVKMCPKLFLLKQFSQLANGSG